MTSNDNSENERFDKVRYEYLIDRLSRLERTVERAQMESARAVEKAESDADRMFVTKTEFDPIRKLMYGFVSLVLIGVVSGLLALVITR